MPVQLYVNLISQPARAVAWVAKVKAIDYEIVQMDFGSPLFKSEEFLAMNPNGLIPVLKDGDFSLFEGNAILTYLADKFDWEDLYPKDLQARAKVNEYLHWHHTNVRDFTLKVVRPWFKRSIGVASPQELEWIKETPAIIAKNNAILEKLLVNDYVARTNTPTLADYAAYCEYDQIEGMGLLDLEKFPKVAAWIERMKQIEHHDEIHVVMNGFLAGTGLATAAKAEPAAAAAQE